MLQPKVWVIKEKKVIDVHAIDFVNKIIFQNTGGRTKKFYPFDEVEFMENTGLKDKHGDYVYVGSILTDEGVLGDDYWDYATIEKDINDGYCISWGNNEFSESLYECSAYSVVGNIYENKNLLEENK